MVGEATGQVFPRRWFSSHWVKGSQGVLRIPGSLVSQDHAEKLLAELGFEQLWQDALHLFRVFKDQRLQPSSSTYEAVARGVQRSWPCSLQALDLQQTEAETLPVGLPQIAKSLRLGGQWPFSLQLLTHAKEHVLRSRDETVVGALWATSEACFQHLEEQGCWLIALRLLADLSRSGWWESASGMNRENLVTSTIGACAVEGQWQLALSLACGPLEAFIGSPALQHVLRACAEAEAWEASLQLLSTKYPCDMTFAVDFLRCLPAEQWQMAVQALEDLASQEKEIDLMTYTSAIQAMFRAEQWRAAFKTFSEIQRWGPKPDLLCCSEILRGLLQITAVGDWHDRDLWRRAMDVLGYMEEETIQPYVLTLNLALEICKDCRALRPVFQIYEVIAPRVRPDPGTFEHLASTCVMAPGQYWWRAIRYMEEAQVAQGLHPQQMTVAIAKSIKACVDASSWSAALFHLGHRLKLDLNPVPGRAAQMDEAIKNYLEDVRAGSLGERGEGIARSIRSRTWSDRWHWQPEVPVRRIRAFSSTLGRGSRPTFKLSQQVTALGRFPAPEVVEGLEKNYRKLWLRQAKDMSQELLGLELLRSSGTLHFETQKAFRRTRGRSILGLRLVMGYRKRWALDASKLLRNDPLLEYQPELGALGVEEALRFLGFNSGRFRSVRPHRKDRLRLLRRHGTTKLLKVRQAAVRGRLPVRRSASKLKPDELANEQAPSAWISYQLILDTDLDREMETTLRQQCAGRCMASGDGLDSLFLPPIKSSSERATHAERVALSSMLNLLSGANRVEGGVLLHTAAALCISCLAAFCRLVDHRKSS